MKKIFVFLCIICLVSCSEDLSNELKETGSSALNSDLPQSNLQVANLASATSESQEFTDWSGRVKIKLFYSTYGPGQSIQGTSAVSADYVLVGGSAWVENTEYGALLTESRPDLLLSTWYAASKDHSYPDSHTLHIVAIGMRLDGVTTDQLRSYMQVYTSTSTSGSQPNTSVTVPISYNLIGGGARANYTGYGSLLTRSHPSGSTWYARSKEHYSPDQATVTAYAIGILKNIPNFGYLDINQSLASTYASSGYGTASTSVPSGWVVSCPGAQATFNNYGRLLSGIKVDPGNAYNATAISKDHRAVDSGYTTAYAVRIQARP